MVFIDLSSFTTCHSADAGRGERTAAIMMDFHTLVDPRGRSVAAAMIISFMVT